MSSEFSLVILAAGFSNRMGIPKLGLLYSMGRTFVENIVINFNQMPCREIILVVNREGVEHIKTNMIDLPHNLKIVLNDYPENERFYSIKVGMRELEFRKKVFLANVDNPFVNNYINNALLENIGEADFICPTYKEKGGHPVLLAENIATDLISQDNGQLNFKEFLKKYTKKTLEVEDKRILANINTPDEYRSAFGNFPIIDL